MLWSLASLPTVLWQNRLLAAVLAAGAVWGHGWHTGRAGERDRWQARTAALVVQRNIATARAAGQAEIIARAAAERAQLLTELEGADRAADTADNPALGADAVRRLLAR
jgi:hypothetical protein